MSLKPTTWPRDALDLAQHDLAVSRRELRTTQRWNTAYRWLALAGWALAVTAIVVHPADAATLPAGSLACDNALAYETQMLTFSETTLVAASGCVFTDRDLVVKVVSGNEVFVEEIGFSVWADVGVLQ